MKKIMLSFLMMLLLVLSSQAQVKFPENLEHVDATKFLIDQEQIKGTHWSVLDKTARNAIPEDKREVGGLVTWVENFLYVTERYEAANTLDANWTDDLNWFGMISENDTILNSVNSIYADTATIALLADTATFAFYADTAFFSLQADSSVYADTALFANKIATVDSVNFNGISKSGYNPGNLIYDTITYSLSFQNDIPEFNHNLGYELVVRVWNESGGLIEDGTVVTLDTIYLNGRPTPTIHNAGMGAIDSLIPIGIATVDIEDDSYGMVTLIGEIKDLNTSAFNTADVLWVGNDGELRNTSPSPPNYSLPIGFVFYSHATEGSIFIQPQAPEYNPSPHISADTARSAYVIGITQNVFEYLPVSHTIVEDSHGFSVVGDSILCNVSGFITIALNLSYIGNIQSDTWRKGVFVNNIEKHTVSRSTSSTSVGNSTVLTTTSIDVGDWISFKITNESAARDPVIVDLSWEIIFLHR